MCHIAYYQATRHDTIVIGGAYQAHARVYHNIADCQALANATLDRPYAP